MIRETFQLMRAQTAPATVTLVTLGYIAGGGNLLSVQGLLVALYAYLVHIFASGHNSVADYMWDLRDPAKQHHPLVSGKMSYNYAVNLINTGIIAVASAGVIMALMWSPRPELALASYVLFVIGGFTYNGALSKTSYLGWIASAISVTSFASYSYWLSASTLTPIGILYISYFFLTNVFQIGYSGYLKEIEVDDQPNMLHKLGARVVLGAYLPTIATIVWAVVVKMAAILVAMYMVFLRPSLPVVIWCIVVSIGIVVILGEMLAPRRWVRSRELKVMSLMEILSFYLVVPIIAPPLESVILMVFGVVYFYLMNKTLWGTSYPRV
ncbi:MAG: UbiA family prenyltransferase [Thaumarchaeota archaeon]|nr:UbiA family prenyltransferase [Candidatus Calditenuaceae archaeon]